MGCGCIAVVLLALAFLGVIVMPGWLTALCVLIILASVIAGTLSGLLE